MNLNPSEIFSFRKPWWYENLFAVSFVAAVVIMGFIGLAVAGGEGSTLEAVGLWSAFLSLLSGGMAGIYFVVRHESQRRAVIHSRLAPLTTPQLIALTGSKEVSEYNQALVVEFLNSQRPGWSFSIDTVNSTS